MLRSDPPSHRRSSEAALLEALGRRDPLALAEACSRTLPVAHAIARRLLPTAELDSLLVAVYGRLWEDPPHAGPLERWVRSSTWSLGVAHLRDTGAAPAVPSVLTIASGLPDPKPSYLDTTERALAALDEEDRATLLRAHDCGVPSSEQGSGAAERLVRALRVLADPDAGTDERWELDPRVGDLVLGLLEADEGSALEKELTADRDRGAQLQTLRRGRRRIEGLPPTPDLGARIVAAVLTGLSTEGAAAPAAAAPAAPTQGSALDHDTAAPDEGAAGAAGAAAGAVGGAAGGAAAAPPSEPRLDDTSPWRPSDLPSSEPSPWQPTEEPAPPAEPAAAAPVGADAPAEADQPPAGPPVESAAPEQSADSALDTGGIGAPPLPSALRDLDDEPPHRVGESTEDLSPVAGPSGPSSPAADPYAELRSAQPRRDPEIDPDDPFADLREELQGQEDEWSDWSDDAFPDERSGEYPRVTGGAHAYGHDEYDEADERSGLSRLMQALGVLLLIAVVIVGGLWAGQTLFRVLTG